MYPGVKITWVNTILSTALMETASYTQLKRAECATRHLRRTEAIYHDYRISRLSVKG